MEKMPSRRKARELAIQVLYALHFSPAKDREALARAFVCSPREDDGVAGERGEQRGGAEQEAAWPEGFAWDLVEGVWTHAVELDGIINRHARTWRTDKLGKIELTLLRLALYELLLLKDAPPKVIINEALELTAQFGLPGAKPLVNGILHAAMKGGETAGDEK